MLPRKSKKDTDYYGKRGGPNREGEILALSDLKTVYHPKPITMDDINAAFFDMVKEVVPEMERPDGSKEKLPTFFVAQEKWADYLKTFSIQDGDRNITRPFCVVSKTATAQGTMKGGAFNIPNNKTFTYYKVPTMEPDGRLIGYDVYKVPQPTNVDFTFEVSISTIYMMQIDQMDMAIFTAFASLQKYINFRGHYFSSTLQSNPLQSDLQLGDRKGYTKTYEILVKGYVHGADDFEIVATPKRGVYNIVID